MKSKYLKNLSSKLFVRFEYDGSNGRKVLTNKQLIEKIELAAKHIYDSGFGMPDGANMVAEWSSLTRAQKLQIVADYLDKVIDDLSNSDVVHLG